MIDRVSFENFKSLENVSIDLGRLTVLVGQNGSGKSSVLQGMHLLSQLGTPHRPEKQASALPPLPTVSTEYSAHMLARRNQIRAAWQRLRGIFGEVRDPRRLVSCGLPATLLFKMHEHRGDELTLAVVVSAKNDDDAPRELLHFQVTIDGLNGPLIALVDETDERGDIFNLLKHARMKQFVSIVYLRLDANEMIRTSIPEGETPRLHSDGSGLASTLAWMKGAAEDEFAEITRALARIVPGVKRIRTLRENVRRGRTERLDIDGQPVWRPVEEIVLGDRFEIEFEEGPPVAADLLSEGTILALGLLTKLHEPERRRLVLLDDIDRGLHIEAQARLVEVLRELLKLDPELQIVCTTHSTHLLNLFEPDEVRVLALDERRRTRAQPLTAHPEFDKWKFGTQTGELWAALGNAWVAAPQEEGP
jgi:predicted ATPase